MIYLTPRQQREIDFHRDHAAHQKKERSGPVNFDVVDEKKRRQHNAFWSTYDRVLAHDLKGKRVLIPGCGFGEDAARLARLGAVVEAFDISPEIVDAARARARDYGYKNINFRVLPSEALDYPGGSFDLVLLIDILHHVDIPQSIAEIVRVLKPGGCVIGNELYTHSLLQKRIRESWLVDKVLYRAMGKLIYGGERPYITADEHKIDETEFAHIERACSDFHADWFNGVVGRLAPDRWPFVEGIDRALMKGFGRGGRYLAGRVVFDGVVGR